MGVSIGLVVRAFGSNAVGKPLAARGGGECGPTGVYALLGVPCTYQSSLAGFHLSIENVASASADPGHTCFLLTGAGLEGRRKRSAMLGLTAEFDAASIALGVGTHNQVAAHLLEAGVGRHRRLGSYVNKGRRWNIERPTSAVLFERTLLLGCARRSRRRNLPGTRSSSPGAWLSASSL